MNASQPLNTVRSAAAWKPVLLCAAGLLATAVGAAALADTDVHGLEQLPATAVHTLLAEPPTRPLDPPLPEWMGRAEQVADSELVIVTLPPFSTSGTADAARAWLRGHGVDNAHIVVEAGR